MARKLLNESAVYPPIFCDPLCDTTKIPYGICPSICGVLCPPFCIPKPLFFETPPLPLPLPPPTPPPPAPIAVSHKSHRLSLALTISLAILAAAFFLFTCYIVYKFCSSWFLSRRRPRPSQRHEEDIGHDDFLDEEHGPIVDHPIWYIRTIGLQPSVISAITIVRYKRGEGLIEGTDCAVCLSEFQEDESLRLLPKCNHAFHIPCIDTWLRSHTNCPMCRAGVVNNAAAPLPSQEPAVQNSGLVEQNQLEISGSNREFTMDLESQSSELRPAIDDDGISRSQSVLKINEDGNGLDGVLPMRRSVSLDSVSASTIHSAIAYAFPGSYSNSDNHLVEVKDSPIEDDAHRIGFNGGLSRLVESQRPMQTAGTSSIKRSVSCSAKVFLSRHSSRNRNSH